MGVEHLVILREEPRLGVFKNRMLRIPFGPKGAEIRTERKKI
jgi:hypothetical protein